MTLNAIKTTSGYIVEGTDAVGKPVELFFDANESANYDKLVDVEATFLKNKEFAEKRAELPDPERDLYLTIFGRGDEPADAVLHTTLAEVQEARNGVSLDWTGDSVTVALRLISKGEGGRLRLIDDMLVDMGPGYTAPQSSGVATPGPGTVVVEPNEDVSVASDQG